MGWAAFTGRRPPSSPFNSRRGRPAYAWTKKVRLLPRTMAENSKVDLPRSRLGDLDCTVCSQLLYDPVTISCGHSYCSRCLKKALGYQSACPACRVPCYYSGKLPINIVLRSILEEALPVETAERRKETEADEAAALDATSRIPLFVLSAVVFPGGTSRFCIVGC